MNAFAQQRRAILEQNAKLEADIARAGEPRAGDKFTKCGNSVVVMEGGDLVTWTMECGSVSTRIHSPIEGWRQLVRATLEHGADFIPAP